jgi:two-component system, chemotaxis family, CheB/CheR fusion protein
MVGKEERDPRFEALIEHIQRHRGFDFRGYKRSSLRRRVEKRMGEVEVASFEGYMDFLEAHPAEFTALLNTILINVTSFFRDAPAWKVLETTVLPGLIERKLPADPIRVWSAGCASGEEPYSLAMLLVAALGEERYRRAVKIYATDMDEEALQSARHASYGPREVEGIPAELLESCFEPGGAGYSFRRDLRKMVIFGRHNIVDDAPISNIDLLICRNVMIYLDSETQSRVLPRLHYALAPGGHLFLGKAETLLARSTLFELVDAKSRLFIKIGTAVGQNHLMTGRPTDHGTAHPNNHEARVLEAALSSSAVGHILVDTRGQVSMADPVVRRLFGLVPTDIGRPFHDLEVSFRPTEMRGPMDEAVKSRKTIRIEEQSWQGPSDDPMLVTIEIVPLFNETGAHDGTAIHFYDVTVAAQLRQRLEEASEELETTVEELQSANEELETTNEELQSTNEELETTNEELQSTNEELETMNEELQSTNEEMETTNDELRVRTDELTSQRNYVDTVIGSIGASVIVVDSNLCVTSWNRWSEDMWGLRTDEVLGQPLLNLDFGLPVGEVRQQFKQALDGKQTPPQIDLDATSRRGRALACRITLSSLSSNGERRGLILIIEDVTERQKAAAVLEEAGRFAENIVSTVREPMLALDAGLKVVFASPAFYQTFRTTPKQTNGRLLYELGNRQWDIPKLRELIERILPDKKAIEDFRVEHDFLKVGRKTMLLNARQIVSEDKDSPMILLAMEEVHDSSAAGTDGSDI